MRVQFIASLTIAVLALTTGDRVPSDEDRNVLVSSGSDDSTFDDDNASGADEEPAETTAPAMPVDGVKMFEQCGGVFYTGSTVCVDPDAYCKQFSIYSSICSPTPLE